MGKQVEPRKMWLRNAEVVVLEPQEYEQLAALRRQTGARLAQLNSLRSRFKAATDLIEALATAAEDLPEDHPVRAVLATRDK